MRNADRIRSTLAAAIVVLTAGAHAQDYREDGWAKLPDGRKWGQTSAIDVDRDGNIWVFERCGANSCAGSNVEPVVKLGPSGNYLRSFGAGMFVFPHGIHMDRDGNVWVTDADGKDGKGHQVVKFSPDGKVLLTLGKAGVAGDGPDTFNRPSDVVTAPNGDISDLGKGHQVVKFSPSGRVLLTLGKAGVAGDGPDTFNRPSDVVTAPNGDIFVADGHGGDSNARIVKLSKDGKFIKA